MHGGGDTRHGGDSYTNGGNECRYNLRSYGSGNVGGSLYDRGCVYDSRVLFGKATVNLIGERIAKG